MATRKLIRIDEARCDGCGECVPACEEGAIRIVGGKARLVDEARCDGLGACLGECPRGAITLEEVEAQAGPSRPAFLPVAGPAHAHGSCPGSRERVLMRPMGAPLHGSPSALRQWPVQLHLLSPQAAFFRGRDVLLAADCVAFAVGDFHARFLDGRSLAIACPKLDSHQEIYEEKLAALVADAGITSLTVAIMEVPCCGGLVRLAQRAVARAGREVPLRCVVVSVDGEVRMDTGLAAAV